MPPLPSTISKEAQVLIESIERRKKDVQDFQIPRLQECKGPLAVQQGYTSSLREDIDFLGRQVQELELMVDEQRSERDRRELGQSVQGYKDEMARIRKSVRAAVLVSKRAVDSQSVSAREELLRTSASSSTTNAKSEKGSDDALMRANADVTNALRRTIGLMQTELERSVLSTQMLEQSSATLRSTSSAYDSLNLVLSTSKQLVTALEKSDWIDRLLIISAVVFFFLVVALILKQRIVDRSLRIAFFWTRFIPSMGLGKHGDLEAAVVLTTTTLATLSSTVATASTSLSSLRSKPSAFEDLSTEAIPPEEISVSTTYIPPDPSSSSGTISPAVESDPSVHDEL
ncbi:Sec20-domain-containing protein [Gloeophyllum trabeum ATCC 11539]|uniref:Sec20-domain-containing protein n=1 Tax=Gloeophyllum trabeum (strain ATCC 11539 / FP-39264 / Madison 617) TaxID=670483 RepID=S7RHZ5_GLOTA|nr:Sec20-domain-containing protein [Gloeophyllum trabeum ATCC 11539]EPQ52224.1 Sec20-domain-containing protein [Gloeophyllum trabeum ATCC 11539]